MNILLYNKYMETKTNKLWQLFSTTFLISASTSGGYAIVGLIKERFVKEKKWIEEDEMVDLLAIAQSSPGPIAINTSILVGYRISGVIGALVTMLGTTLPPLIIMSVVAAFYEQFKNITVVRYIMHGMQAGVAALLVSVTIDLFTNLTKQKSILSYVLFVVAFILVRFTNINVLYIAIGCAIAGIIKVFSMKEVK